MKKRVCEECSASFEPAVDSQLTCSDACSTARRRRKHAEWQRTKWADNAKWRKARLKKNYARIKARAAQAKVSVRKLRENA